MRPTFVRRCTGHVLEVGPDDSKSRVAGQFKLADGTMVSFHGDRHLVWKAHDCRIFLDDLTKPIISP